MNSKLTNLFLCGALLLASLLGNGCHSSHSDVTPQPASPPAAQPLPSEAESVEKIIRSLENRVKLNPEDFIAQNKLAGYYLQRLRETGDLTYLDLASKTAQASLNVLPADQSNSGGLANLTYTEYASHDFTAARDHANQLIALDAGKSYPYQLLGDALLELGEYQKAAEAFQKMDTFSKGAEGNIRSAIEQRFARMAFLRGDFATAQHNYTAALNAALEATVPSRETIAWCYWQLGETAFAKGDYEAAEKYCHDALTPFPNYFKALAALGRVRAARGDLNDAIVQYEHAVRIIPDPSFVATLGDLYQLAGREKEAKAQYALVEHIGRLSKINGVVYNRLLAHFYADHDQNPEEAYKQAIQEYTVRKDIYGADIVAWTALKAGKLTEAQTTIKEAFRLGTKDAVLFYHAGMIARATGDKAGARTYLEQALKLNPQFDPLQATIARKTLQELS